MKLNSFAVVRNTGVAVFEHAKVNAKGKKHLHVIFKDRQQRMLEFLA